MEGIPYAQSTTETHSSEGVANGRSSLDPLHTTQEEFKKGG